jgi:hypothetical protein
MPRTSSLHRQRIEVVPLAATALDEVEQRVLVLAVHAVDGVLLAQQRRADFQGGEMQRHEDHALAVALGLLQMLQAFDMGQRARRLRDHHQLMAISKRRCRWRRSFP